MYKRYENCKILNPFWEDIHRLLVFTVLDGEGNKHLINIMGSRCRLSKELSKIASGELSHGIYACGMTDIDMWFQSNGDVLIEWSPCESQMLTFHVTAANFATLVNWAQQDDDDRDDEF